MDDILIILLKTITHIIFITITLVILTIFHIIFMALIDTAIIPILLFYIIILLNLFYVTFIVAKRTWRRKIRVVFKLTFYHNLFYLIFEVLILINFYVFLYLKIQNLWFIIALSSLHVIPLLIFNILYLRNANKK